MLHPPNGATRQLLFENGLASLRVALMYHTATTPAYFYPFDLCDHFMLDDLLSKRGDEPVSGALSLDYDLFIVTVADLLPAPCNADMLCSSGAGSDKEKLKSKL